ncbi:MAG TPA: response regulator transcription factor, partial [Candidatus Limnocylindria bacterium]|nr:response regulator transcription factor [Candidatus Limnocylindria bacterium]
RRSKDGLVPPARKMSFRDGDLVVDFEHGLALKQGRDAALTPSEMRMLTAFVRYPGKVFTRAELIEIALVSGFDGYERAVDNHVKNLRQKIEDDTRNPAYVLTVHGLGYKFGG